MAAVMALKFDLSLLPEAPDFSFEIPLWDFGMINIAGIDEAGRGALAGPVAAAAIIFHPTPSLSENLVGVRDSKELTSRARTYWVERLQEIAVAWEVGFASHQEIDDMGIVPATCLAIQRALDSLQVVPQHLLVDYLELPDSHIPQTSLVKGDARSLSIAAASILAKTARDTRLRELDAQYPGYGFAKHKGYGTASHREALALLGPSPVHRLSFRPLKRDGVEE